MAWVKSDWQLKSFDPANPVYAHFKFDGRNVFPKGWVRGMFTTGSLSIRSFDAHFEVGEYSGSSAFIFLCVSCPLNQSWQMVALQVWLCCRCLPVEKGVPLQ